MVVPILERQSGSGPSARGGTIQAISRSWRAAGAAGAAGAGVALAASGAVALWWWPETARAVGAVVAVLTIGVAALVDAVEHRLPNRVVALATVPVVLTVVLTWSPSGRADVAAGAALVAVPLLVTHLVTPAGMGFGDVKAGAVLGAALGLVDPRLAVLALVLGLAAGAAWGLTRRARSIPLGPFLVAGALAALAVGRLLDPKGRL